MDRAADVDVDLLLSWRPIVTRTVRVRSTIEAARQVGRVQHARIVEEHIQGGEALHHLLIQLTAALGRAYVCAYGVDGGELLLGCVQRLLLAAGDNDGAASCQVLLDEAEADACRAAGDEHCGLVEGDRRRVGTVVPGRGHAATLRREGERKTRRDAARQNETSLVWRSAATRLSRVEEGWRMESDRSCWLPADSAEWELLGCESRPSGHHGRRRVDASASL